MPRRDSQLSLSKVVEPVDVYYNSPACRHSLHAQHIVLTADCVLRHAGISSESMHAEPDPRAVVTRLQYMSKADMKWTMSFLRGAEVIAAALLALILVAKLRDKDQWLATRRHLSIADTAIFAFMFLLLLALFASFAARVHHSVRWALLTTHFLMPADPALVGHCCWRLLAGRSSLFLADAVLML